MGWRAKICGALRFHFLQLHVQYTVVILEEGIHPLTLCPKCDMIITWRALNGKHQATVMYARWEEWKRKQ